MADAAGKTQLGPDRNSTRTRKLFSSFLFKAAVAVLVLVFVPVMSSHPPEYIVGQAAPVRGWEILHILFVGIAVSYGLFSKRNAAVDGAEEGEKNGSNANAGKLKNTQTYVNRFLQLSSSLFDDDSDDGGISPSGSDVGRIQSMACNSQYFRNEPMLVVDEDLSGGGCSSRISDKPLLLPVRSLHSRVPDDPRDDSGYSGVSSAPLNRSGSMRLRSCDSRESSVPNTSFRRSISNPWSISKRGLNGGSNNWGEMSESSVSAASFGGSGSDPGSNSKRVANGSLIRLRNGGRVSGTVYPALETNVKDSVVLPSPIPWQSRSGRMEVKDGVDSVNTFEIDDLGEARQQVSWSPSTTFSTPSTPSPKRISPSSSFSSVSPEAYFVTDKVKKMSSFSQKSRIPVPPPPPPPIGATFRLPTEKPRLVNPVNGKNSFSEYREVHTGLPKSVRMARAAAETDQDNVSGKDLEHNFFEGGIENEDGKQEFFKKMIIKLEDKETENYYDDNSDSEDDGVADADPGAPKDRVPLPSNEEVEVVSHGASDGGPDVDKKADEFIAMFREQIRLQRIESIKRSSAEISSKNSARR
ncbi:hypothetical protein MLD38_020880 [Melastoma candidum]|uniref:Uncharacterized protein n=1 Tax=Melastoma candidum TaxID=119954 RepID=A0ACB9QG88_9MYRT|nr:hypothetical protein MLD38_020880 [Melastoma candidum]